MFVRSANRCWEMWRGVWLLLGYVVIMPQSESFLAKVYAKVKQVLHVSFPFESRLFITIVTLKFLVCVNISI